MNRTSVEVRNWFGTSLHLLHFWYISSAFSTKNSERNPISATGNVLGLNPARDLSHQSQLNIVSNVPYLTVKGLILAGRECGERHTQGESFSVSV